MKLDGSARRLTVYLGEDDTWNHNCLLYTSDAADE